ncbi:ATP-binding protein, partial [Streptomyces lavendulae]
GQKLAQRIRVQPPVPLRDRGGELVAEHLDQVLRAERDRRLAPLEALEVTPEPQAELIAALSLLQKER